MLYNRIFEQSITFSKRNRVLYFRIFMHIDARDMSPPLTFCCIIEYPPQSDEFHKYPKMTPSILEGHFRFLYKCTDLQIYLGNRRSNYTNICTNYCISLVSSGTINNFSISSYLISRDEFLIFTFFFTFSNFWNLKMTKS